MLQHILTQHSLTLHTCNICLHYTHNIHSHTTHDTHNIHLQYTLHTTHTITHSHNTCTHSTHTGIMISSSLGLDIVVCWLLPYNNNNNYSQSKKPTIHRLYTHRNKLWSIHPVFRRFKWWWGQILPIVWKLSRRQYSKLQGEKIKVQSQFNCLHLTYHLLALVVLPVRVLLLSSYWPVILELASLHCVNHCTFSTFT